MIKFRIYDNQENKYLLKDNIHKGIIKNVITENIDIETTLGIYQ